MRAAFLPLCLIIVLGLSLPAVTSSIDHSPIGDVSVCVECHPRALPSHNLSVPGEVAGSLPLGPSGNMVCLTCHDCISGTCVLRRQSLELCRACHDCTQGMACLLGVAHLGDKANIDDLSSRTCLSCHDGLIAADAGSPGNHKVDVFYVPGRNFNSVKDRKIILVNGKVKCISCHNPYKNEERRLVKSNERSRLCLTCHKK